MGRAFNSRGLKVNSKGCEFDSEGASLILKDYQLNLRVESSSLESIRSSYSTASLHLLQEGLQSRSPVPGTDSWPLDYTHRHIIYIFTPPGISLKYIHNSRTPSYNFNRSP